MSALSTRAVAALAVADFRDRVRRPAYLVTVSAAVALGYLAAPPGAGNYALLKIGAYRGLYDSAYVGTLMALVGALWLALGGFYVVKNALAKDRSTGVGELLAASPVSGLAYLLGKALSNLLILASAAGFLAVTALGMQLLRGESTRVDLVALWLPFLLLCLPMLAVSAAAAVLFESVPLLRGGLGNVIWFFLFICGLGGGWHGLSAVEQSLRADLLADHPDATNTEISLGFTVEDAGLGTFEWSGLELTAALVSSQLGLVGVAVLLVVMPALWFHRFDPARLAPSGITGRRAQHVVPALAVPAPAQAAPAAVTASVAPPRSVAAPGAAVGRLVAGELRVLLRRQSRWWWVVMAGLAVAALWFPSGEGLQMVLLLAWIWPILIWSRLGAHPYEHGVNLLVEPSCGPHRRLLAQWLAGVAIAGLAGAGPLMRMVLDADLVGVAAGAAGATFISALALLLGVLSRGTRLFQVAYLMLWYLVVNGMAAVDYLGAVRDGDRLAGPHPATVVAVSAGLLAATFLTSQLRHARR